LYVKKSEGLAGRAGSLLTREHLDIFHASDALLVRKAA